MAAQAELAAIPQCPSHVAYLWNYFLQIAETERPPPSGMEGRPNRIPRAGIRAWEQDEGVELERWERRCIIALDAAWHGVQLDALAAASAQTPQQEAHLRGPQERHG